MSKTAAEQPTADAVFWALADARAQLMSERAALCHAGGRPPGFAVLNWESPARRRVSLLAAQIAETDAQFEQARARFAATMRVRVAGEAAAMREVFSAQVAAAAARPSSEFAAQRVQARAVAAIDFDDAAALRALEQKMQRMGGGKR